MQPIPFDADGNGLVDGSISDVDMNGDGITDAVIVRADTNMDGIIDTEMAVADLNQDGQLDAFQFDHDADGDGNVDISIGGLDADGDGHVDFLNVESNGEDVWGGLAADSGASEASPDPFAFLDSTYVNVPSVAGSDFYEVHGTPSSDMSLWEMQDDPNSCAVATTNMVFRSVGIESTEAEIAKVFSDCGIYDPMRGTSPDMIDDVINAWAERSGADIRAVQIDNFDAASLQEMLDNGIRPLVGVDAAELYPGGDQSILDLFGYPDAGHAVQVTGIIHSPEGNFVVINDPAFPAGAGQRIPMEQFMDAAADCGYQAIAVVPTDSQQLSGLADSMPWLQSSLIRAGVFAAAVGLSSLATSKDRKKG